jgi:hypothetical protein
VEIRTADFIFNRRSIMADISVKCAECGSDVTAEFEARYLTAGAGYAAVLSVTPCEKCIDAARDKGYQDARGEQ